MTEQEYSEEEKEQIYQYGKAYLESLGIYDIDMERSMNKPPKILINGEWLSPGDINIKSTPYSLWLQAKIKQICESTGIIESVFQKHIKKDEFQKIRE